MASCKLTNHRYQPGLTGWSPFVGMVWMDAAAAPITNQPRGY
jgi:hypothetical protein